MPGAALPAAASEVLPPLCGVGGWVGVVYPSALLQARTAASDGHTASTRAARSAGLRFAVILLSKAMDVGRDHLIHRKRSPFPYEGKALTCSKVSVAASVGRNTPRIPASEALPPLCSVGVGWRGLPLRTD